ncbi:MAG: nucleotidyltransferase domain-containing protein [Cyclobacteriaceae bacterium]|nr:nucleotidyltransferase domain-containing protein [Cyclobacteriaceae bacterium]
MYIFEETYRMNSIIKNNIEQITTLCNSYNVKSLFVFGSVCTPDFNKTSDIDLLISFNQMNYADYADNFFLLADKFEELFKRPVDLVTDKSLSNPYFIKSVNKTKSLIYGLKFTKVIEC